MRLVLARSAVGLLLVAASACGMSEESSRATWGSVKSALSDDGSGQALSISLGAEADCREAGSLKLDANLAIGEDAEEFAPDADAVFAYEIEFLGCQPDENTLDGNLEYAAVANAEVGEGTATAEVVFIYRGTVHVSGEETGTCEIDMEGRVSAQAVGGGGNPGDEFNASVDVVYTGTVCGNDASETLNVSVSSDDDAEDA